jgi:hypothetical protein
MMVELAQQAADLHQQMIWFFTCSVHFDFHFEFNLEFRHLDWNWHKLYGWCKQTTEFFSLELAEI